DVPCWVACCSAEKPLVVLFCGGFSDVMLTVILPIAGMIRIRCNGRHHGAGALSARTFSRTPALVGSNPSSRRGQPYFRWRVKKLKFTAPALTARVGFAFS